ncbi:RNA ligase 1 isoform 3-T3 [Spinachia spinachia]
MRRLGSVQQKVPCVFVTEVKQEPSTKRDSQQFQVVATARVSPVAVDAQVHRAVATEKLDGTCCYVSVYKGRPHLWARLDRKANKQAEKRFKKYQRSHHGCKGFLWSVEEDFKPVPETWVPALRVKHHEGHPVPDEHGHIPGWIPVEKDSKQYCWHASVLDPDLRAALVLRPCAEDEDALEVAALPLANLLEQTLELIGTNVNGNPSGEQEGARPPPGVSRGPADQRPPPGGLPAAVLLVPGESRGPSGGHRLALPRRDAR